MIDQKTPLRNWAGNLEYSTGNVFYPETVSAIQDLLRKLPNAKALGSRHCFNNIADSKHSLISMARLNRLVSINKENNTVTLEGGMNYGTLCPLLESDGYALHNLASLPHISVAGACATATHGSGMTNGNLATIVKRMEIVRPDGEIVTIDSESDRDLFNAQVVGLGAIGVISKITLALQPSYWMKQYVFEEMPLSLALQNFDKIMRSGYSVSLFTDWTNESINEVWIKMLEHDNDPGAVFYEGRAATKNVHPIIDLDAENCTDQMGTPGLWYEILPHFKMGFTPSSGTELQSEYFVPVRHAGEAISAVQRMGNEISPHLLISEIRAIAADNLWMSPCYRQDSVAIHFTWKQEPAAVMSLLPKIERELSGYQVRPHWGKLFTIPKETLAERYEKLDEFRMLVSQVDPTKKLVNKFLASHVLA